MARLYGWPGGQATRGSPMGLAALLVGPRVRSSLTAALARLRQLDVALAGASPAYESWFIYDTGSGDEWARPVTRSGTCPIGHAILQPLSDTEILVIGVFDPPEGDDEEPVYDQTIATLYARLRAVASPLLIQRIRRLVVFLHNKSDRLMTSDVYAVLTPTQQSDWTAFRSALRGIESQPGYPDTITWPSIPAWPAGIPE